MPIAPWLGLLLTLGIFASVVRSADSDRVPLFQADQDNPTVRGAALGQAYRDRWPALEARWDAYLQHVFSAAGGDAQSRFDTLLKARIEPLRTQGISQDARAEVEGLGSAWSLVGGNRLGDGQLSHDELWAAQLLPDLGLVGRGVGYAVFGPATADGGSLVGRQRDALSVYPGDNASSAEEPPLAITVTDPWAGVGFAGQLAPPTGMNAAGLFISQFPIPHQRLVGFPASARASGFALREVLHREGAVSQAVAALSRQRFATSLALLIADADRAVVVEQAAGAPGQPRTADSPTQATLSWGRAEQLAVVSCFALRDLRGDCQGLRDRFRWQRLRELGQFSATGLQARLDDMLALLQDTANPPYALFGSDTVETLLFQPREQRLYLRTLSSPAEVSDSLPLYQPFPKRDPDRRWAWALGLLLTGALLGLTIVALARHRIHPVSGRKIPAE